MYACAFVGVNEYARWVYGAGLGFFSWPIQRAHGEEWREGFRRSHTTIQTHVHPHTLQNRGQMVTPFYGCTSRCAPFAKASSLITSRMFLIKCAILMHTALKLILKLNAVNDKRPNAELSVSTHIKMALSPQVGRTVQFSSV